jgi:benzoate/toluate 1,2-dioxygenase alpha subunit/2,4,5-trichlorophenoxyacetic acid oxygenase 1
LKLQFENGLDYYHFASTHSSYIDVLGEREVRRGPPEVKSWNPIETDPDAARKLQPGEGHAMMWSIHASRVYKLRPSIRMANFVDGSGADLEDKLRWMFRQRNLTIYPNLQIVDIGTLQLRTCIIGSRTRRRLRLTVLPPVKVTRRAAFCIRLYEDFFNPSGLATSDDNVSVRALLDRLRSRFAGPTQGMREA